MLFLERVNKEDTINEEFNYLYAICIFKAERLSKEISSQFTS